jgi:hypothetical protein
MWGNLPVGRRVQAFGLTLLLTLTVTTFASPSSALAAPYRAFSASSYWNQPLPINAPTDRNAAQILGFLKNDNATNYVRFAGAGSNGNWGNPIYWSGPGDPTYAVQNNCSFKMAPEFQSVRIPTGAQSDSSTSDAAMTVYDVDKGLVYGFWRASFQNNEWSSCGGTVYYLNSNGLDGVLAQSDEPRNFGHRGVPPPTYAVRYDEIQAGVIDHVLKIAVNNTADENVFPMTGHENGSTDPYAPPEGTRIRIKPSVDLSTLGLSPAARVVATALQKYGAVIGDQSGGTAILKVENTVAEGRGWLWSGVLNADSLSSIPLDMYEVIQLGYGSDSAPTPPAVSPPSAPTGLSAAAASDTRIDLSWSDNATNEDGFRIERSPNGTTDWSEIGTTGPNVSSFSHTGLGPGTTHHYRVRAYNVGGNSVYSNSAAATTKSPPVAPSALDATASSSVQINLAWTDGSATEDGFRVERSPNGATDWAEIGTTGPNVSRFSDVGLSAGTTYHYRVRAYNAYGNSAYSNVDSATTPALLPSGVTLYLHNYPTPPTGNTSARKHLSMNPTEPTATTLYKYSTNYYTAQPGRWVDNRTVSHTESSTSRMANWIYQLPATANLAGNAELQTWVAARDFRCDKTVTFKAFLRRKTSATTDSGTLLATATGTSPPQASAPCNFRLATVTLPVNATVPAGAWLELKLAVNYETGTDGLFAYDTSANRSFLKLP